MICLFGQVVLEIFVTEYIIYFFDIKWLLIKKSWCFCKCHLREKWTSCRYKTLIFRKIFLVYDHSLKMSFNFESYFLRLCYQIIFFPKKSALKNSYEVSMKDFNIYSYIFLFETVQYAYFFWLKIVNQVYQKQRFFLSVPLWITMVWH